MTTSSVAVLIRSLLLEGVRKRVRKDIRNREREGKMTYQHGKDIFLVFLLEEDEDI